MILCCTNSTLPLAAPNPGNNILVVFNCTCLHCEINVHEYRGVYYSGSNTCNLSSKETNSSLVMTIMIIMMMIIQSMLKTNSD